MPLTRKLFGNRHGIALPNPINFASRQKKANAVKIKLEKLCKLKQDLAALRLAMQKKIGVRFVPRAALNAKPRSMAGAAAALAALALCGGLSACAEDRNYPSLSKVSDLGSILTQQEQQKFVSELQKDRQGHSGNP